MSRYAVLVGLAVAGCFAPQPVPGAPCSAEGTCPSGLACVANVCVIPGAFDAGDDARGDAPVDTMIDAPPIDAPSGPVPVLVQEAWAFSTPNTTVTAKFSTAPTAGHTLVMVGGCPSNALASVSGGAASWQRVAYATAYANVETYVGVANGADSVTVALPTCAGQISISVSEWDHVDAVPIEAGLGTFGTVSPASAGSLTATGTRLLLFSASTYTPNTFGAPGAGWSALMPIVDTTETRTWYRVVGAGSFAPSVSLTSTQWDAVLVALPAN